MIYFEITTCHNQEREQMGRVQVKWSCRLDQVPIAMDVPEHSHVSPSATGKNLKFYSISSSSQKTDVKIVINQLATNISATKNYIAEIV